MTTMATTPVVLLGAFCAILALLGVGRLAIDDDWDFVDLGATILVVGIALLSILWAALEQSWLTAGLRLLLAVVGVGVSCLGVGLIVRYWDDPSPARQIDAERCQRADPEDSSSDELRP